MNLFIALIIVSFESVAVLLESNISYRFSLSVPSSFRAVFWESYTQ